MENNIARLNELKDAVERMEKIINCPFKGVAVYEDIKHLEASSYVEVDDTDYHHVIINRGEERGCFTTASLDEFLEHLFCEKTDSMARDYELEYRIEGKDSRRISFPYQIELLALLSPQWADHEAKRHQEILRKRPFVDQ